MPEFGDVGAREKCPSGADNDYRLGAVGGVSPSQGLGEAGAHFVLQRVNRRIIDDDDGNLTVGAEIDTSIDVTHDTPDDDGRR